MMDTCAPCTLVQAQGLQLVVDNTFSPMIMAPARLGADVVVHSLTKFVSGSSDIIAGVPTSCAALPVARSCHAQ